MVEAVSEIKICEGECNCCMARIYSSIKDHADEWKALGEMQFAETPLHGAAAAGNTAVAVEVLNLMPSLGRKLNKEGLSPLHLAIKGGHRDTARTLARLDKQLVRVKGEGGLTPLMKCAAGASDEDGRKLLACLLVACPESVTDVNNRHQTVVHVALENKNCDAVCVLVDWLRRRDQVSPVLTVKDIKGNTVLHAAAQFDCVKGAEKLVGLVKLNRRNSDKKTALDVGVEHQQTAVVEILKKRGARRSSEIKFPPKTTIEYVLTEVTSAEAVSRAYYYLTKQLTLEMRSAVLVVATLIVAATYQAVLQPPGGLYPAANGIDAAVAHLTSRHMQRQVLHRRQVSGDVEALRQHIAGQMVMQEKYYLYFMPSNTFAFSLSTVIIIFVVPGSPVFLMLHICLVFMCIGYLLALNAISAYTGISNVISIMALYAIVGAFFVKLNYYPVKALFVEEDWWLRRFSVRVSNYWSKIGFSTEHSKAIAVLAIPHNMKKQHIVLDLK